MKEGNFTLLQYASMAICALSGKSLSAQAVYTDLEPDVVLDMDPQLMNLDMNSDGVMDFAFLNEIYTVTTSTWSFYYSYRERIWAGPLNPNNAIAGSLNQFTLSYGGLSTYYYPFALAFNTPINEALEFQNAGYQMMAFRTYKQFGTNWNHGGNWYPEVMDKFLGVRFLDTLGCNHYGWIRCDVLEEGRVLVVKDYAYETKCDSGILAGDTVGDTTEIVNINTPEIGNYSIWSSGKIIYIDANTIEFPTVCKIINLQGQMVYETLINKGKSELNLENFNAGIYLVNLTNNKGLSIVKKVELH